MQRTILRTIAFRSFVLVVMVVAARQAPAQEAQTPYPRMAPVDQYLMERNAEMALAKSAAPESISRDAEVMVLGRHGYETALQGKNGFVCMVWRSWAAGIDDPEFWNAKLRAPICFNPPAARFNIPLTVKKTELLLAGRSKTQMFEDISSALDKKELPALESGAMCYMMSKQGYLSDRGGHWHPHLMFFVPLTESASWGAGLPGSPVVVAFADTPERHTVFLVPVAKWSDGTADSTAEH
ncbi:MAG TPA: hypothetical protein VK514_01965 [Candidatus Acidoferrum sp.]|nr:hypothetical protein [Candidatus Acidoferrum sp.]